MECLALNLKFREFLQESAKQVLLKCDTNFPTSRK